MKNSYLLTRKFFPHELRAPFEIENTLWEPINAHEHESDLKSVAFDFLPISFHVFWEACALGTITENNKHIFLLKVKQVVDEIKLIYNNQYVLVLVLTTAHDSYQLDSYFDILMCELEKHFPNKALLIHPFKNIKKFIYYDIFFNYTKAYYMSYDRVNANKLLGWNYSTKENFALNSIKPRNIHTAKVFLCANRVLYDELGKPQVENNPKMLYREKLLRFLRGKNGYLSDFKNDVILPTETSDANTFLSREKGNGHWIPVANSLYNSSYVSVFVETTITNRQEFITEKTFDPLIKGHFILPFGYSGIIRDLKNMGFLFPDWIDYSYDDVINESTRFSRFTNSLDKLIKIPIPELNSYFNNDIHILEHNKGIFKTKKYDPLYAKIAQWLTK